MGWKYIKMLMMVVLCVEDLLFGSRPNIIQSVLLKLEQHIFRMLFSHEAPSSY